MRVSTDTEAELSQAVGNAPGTQITQQFWVDLGLGVKELGGHGFLLG